MKTELQLFRAGLFWGMALGIGWSFSLATVAESSADFPSAESLQTFASQIGAKAGADYRDDGLAVIPTSDGVRLRCVFQRLEGEATSEGLWLTSTVTNAANDRFCIVAAAIGRQSSIAGDEATGLASIAGIHPEAPRVDSQRVEAIARVGTVAIDGQRVRFTRPWLVEEYSVSTDGVRQDFVVLERPDGAEELAVWLAVSGAKVEPAPFGAWIVLENSERKIAYSRLRVTDATGKELTARIEVASGILPEGAHPAARKLAGDFSAKWLQDSPESAGLEARALLRAGVPPATMLTVLVNDAEAVYPVRIDPTFSDANWISMGGILGADRTVFAAVVDDSGNLYIGGSFTVVGDVIANRIAKWDGNSWTALGQGMDNAVSTLVVSGSEVYAGGSFTNAGGGAANYIAKWDGNSWTALGSGMNNGVQALAVSGSDVYAGGYFTNAGGSAANYIAKWNGSSWSALGSGMGGGYAGYKGVYALAVSGSDVYAGGHFTTAGGSTAYHIAKWDGSSWSALGEGMNGPPGTLPQVRALVVSGSDVYAGGYFTAAGSSTAYHIAKWNGSSWSAVGGLMSPELGPQTDSPRVLALAVSGSDVYAGGSLGFAVGGPAKYIAKWNGSSWSALGSETDGPVLALAVSGSDLYAGGAFTTAGGKVSAYIARAYLLPLPALSVLRSDTEVMVSWPSADTAGFVLEQTRTLPAPAGWVTNTASVTDDGANKSVTIQTTNSPQFFRLRRQ